MTIIVLSPKPAILPSKASVVFFNLEIALFNSIISFDFNCLISIIAIVYPSLNAFNIGVTSSKLFKTKGLTITFDFLTSLPKSISIYSGSSSPPRPERLFFKSRNVRICRLVFDNSHVLILPLIIIKEFL